MRRLQNPLALAAFVWLGAAATAAAAADFEWIGQLAPGQRIEVVGVNGSIQATDARGGGNRHDPPAGQQDGKQLGVAAAHALEALFDPPVHTAELALVAAVHPALQQQADRDRRQCPRGALRGEHRKDDREAERGEQVFRRRFEKDHRGEDAADHQG